MDEKKGVVKTTPSLSSAQKITVRWEALHLFATFLFGEKDGVDVG